MMATEVRTMICWIIILLNTLLVFQGLCNQQCHGIHTHQDDPVWQIHRFLSKNILLFEEKTPVLALFFVVYIVSFHGIKQNKLKWISLLCVYLFVCCHLTAHAQKRRRKIFDGTNGLPTQSKKGKNTILLLTNMHFPPKIQQLIIENYYILLIFIHIGSI